MKVSVSRKAHFNAAHRLFRKEWSDEKNERVFGKCSNPNYHGHNYELVVTVTGEINEETGFVMDLKDLKDLIYEKVEVPSDHKNLKRIARKPSLFLNITGSIISRTATTSHRKFPVIRLNLQNPKRFRRPNWRISLMRC